MSKLSLEEMGQLRILEKRIEAGKKSFVDVGLALSDIKEKRLYRKTHDTFEAYYQERWGFGRRYGNLLIESAVAVKALPKNLGTMVPTERAARALAQLPAEARPKVLDELKKSGKTATSATITQQYAKIKSQVQDRSAGSNTHPSSVELELDETGCVVPEKALAIWHRRDEAQELLTAVTRLKSRLKQGMEDKDPLFHELNIGAIWQRLTVNLSNVYGDLQLLKPYAVCPQCQGKLVEKCPLCGGRGVVSKFQYLKVPEASRKMREKKKAK